MSDYSHRFHVGNVGDVWKHVLQIAWFEAQPAGARRVLDTHAGEGRYALGGTGEWTAAWGPVRALQGPLPAAVARYRALLAEIEPVPMRYPGSPAIFQGLLADGDRMVSAEQSPEAARALRAAIGVDARVEVFEGDGWARLREGAPTAVFIDPPYTERDDWNVAANVMADTYARLPAAHQLLWYPIKSFTRPNALHAALRARSVPFVALDLLTTPIERKVNRLNGSGVLLVNPPPGVIAAGAAAASALGPTCASDAGWWSLRVVGQGA